MTDNHGTSHSFIPGSVTRFASLTAGDALYCVIITDPSFNVVFADGAALAGIFGGDSGLIGRDLLEELHELDDSIDATEVRAIWTESATCSGIISVSRQAQSPSRLIIRCQRLTDHANQHVSGFVVTIDPHGDPRGFESEMVAVDRMLTRGEMAGEIAHEINNCLTILLGNLELIPLLVENRSLDTIGRKIPLMRRTLEKIAGFSDSLLSYGKPQHRFEAVDLNHIISEAIDFLKPQNRYDGIRIEVELSPDIPPVMGDSGQLKQVIVNLLNNAADELAACREPRPVIRVKTSSSEDAASAVVSVSDNGRGIPEGMGPALFRSRFSTKRAGEGYGLLACKIIVDRHGGDISFDTAAGSGTRFQFRVPSYHRSDLESERAGSEFHEPPRSQ
jgi:signal transduction histidine kinase